MAIDKKLQDKYHKWCQKCAEIATREKKLKKWQGTSKATRESAFLSDVAPEDMVSYL